MTTEKRQRNGVPGAVQKPRAESLYEPQSTENARTRFATVDQVIFDVNNASVAHSVYMTKVIHKSRNTAQTLPSASNLQTTAMPSDRNDGSQTPTPSPPLVALRDAPHRLPEQVPAEVLEVVLKYCYFHTSRNKARMKSQAIREWDDKYVQMDPRRLCELASAAYYLEIPPLVELTCRAIANIISGKDPDQIRDTFQIENDLLQRFMPRDGGHASGRRGVGSNRGGNRRHGNPQPFQQTSRKQSSYNLAAIDDVEQPESDESVAKPEMSSLPVPELVEWINGNDSNGKRNGKKRKKKRGKQKASAEPNGTSTEPNGALSRTLADIETSSHVRTQLQDQRKEANYKPKPFEPPVVKAEVKQSRTPNGSAAKGGSSDDEVIFVSETRAPQLPTQSQAIPQDPRHGERQLQSNGVRFSAATKSDSCKQEDEGQLEGSAHADEKASAKNTVPHSLDYDSASSKSERSNYPSDPRYDESDSAWTTSREPRDSQGNFERLTTVRGHGTVQKLERVADQRYSRETGQLDMSGAKIGSVDGKQLVPNAYDDAYDDETLRDNAIEHNESTGNMNFKETESPFLDATHAEKDFDDGDNKGRFDHRYRNGMMSEDRLKEGLAPSVRGSAGTDVQRETTHAHPVGEEPIINLESGSLSHLGVEQTTGNRSSRTRLTIPTNSGFGNDDKCVHAADGLVGAFESRSVPNDASGGGQSGMQEGSGLDDMNKLKKGTSQQTRYEDHSDRDDCSSSIAASGVVTRTNESSVPVKSPEINPTGTSLNVSDRPFIHCPESMNREVADFEKRLCADVSGSLDRVLAARGQETPDKDRNGIDGAKASRSEEQTGYEMARSGQGRGCQQERIRKESNDLARHEKHTMTATDVQRWERKLEEAVLVERESHLKELSDVYSQQMTARDLEREQIREDLGQVRIERAQLRDYPRTPSQSNSIDPKLQEAKLIAREAVLKEMANRVSSQVVSLHKQKDEVLDRLWQVRKQLSNLRK